MEKTPEMVKTLEDILSDFAALDATSGLLDSSDNKSTSSKAPVEPIGDFKVGLQWFNCSEPLSIGRQLRGKIVVLDFFTYCCINCLHILPHLRQVEERFSIETGVVVIGVHSAKFDNEKDSENISAALKRYDITHPVVNDCDGDLWAKLGISCWPTVLVLGPDGQPLHKLVGEFNADHLVNFIDSIVTYFGSCGKLSPHSLPLSSSTSLIKGPLLFPGKVTSFTQDDGSELIAIANSGLHTIIITSADGIIKHVIGNSGKPGFTDGNFSTTLFNAPQGLAFASCYVLFVADTENHAIRKIDLKNENVVTIVGNGLQGSDNVGGGMGTAQSISSPWDLCFIRRKVPSTPHLPPPFMCICPPAPPGHISLTEVPLPPPQIPQPPPVPRIPAPPLVPRIPAPPPVPQIPAPPPAPQVPAPPPVPFNPGPPPPIISAFNAAEIAGEETTKDQEVLLIAMAGCHQIWALFFQDTTWWGKEFFAAGTCASIAGSGNEANRNNSYPRSASFAQPSGLTYCPKLDEVFIADSESSSVRSISLKTGKVSAVVGGSKTPDDLFSFGDIDGDSFNVKLQHPLGVAWHNKSERLFVADSYNHKIKIVRPSIRSCLAYIGTGKPGNQISDSASQFNEPGGLCVNADQNKLYIADTNNHSIKVFDLEASVLSEMSLSCANQEPEDKTDEAVLAVPLEVNFDGRIMFYIDLSLSPQLKFTEGAPQRWSLHLPNLAWKCDTLSGTFDSNQSASISVTAPSSGLQQSFSRLQLRTKLFVCEDDVCKVASPSLTFSVKCSNNSVNELFYKTVMRV